MTSTAKISAHPADGKELVVQIFEATCGNRFKSSKPLAVTGSKKKFCKRAKPWKLSFTITAVWFLTNVKFKRKTKMRKWGRTILFAFAAALFTPFAFAFDVCKPLVARAFDEYEGYGKADAKFKAELFANYGCRTSEATHANALLKDSNGFRMANIFKATALPFEVGWRRTATV